MHLLIATPYFPSAVDPGAGSFIRRQALALARRGHRVEILHIQPRPPALWRRAPRWRLRTSLPEHEVHDGLAVYRAYYPSTTQRRPLWRFQAAAIAHGVTRALARHPELGAVDALYAQWLVPFGWGCLRAARRAGIPCLAIARGADLNLWGRRRALRRQLLALVEQVDALLGNGEWVRPALARAAGGDPGRPVDVVYNPCDLSPFFALDRDDTALRAAVRARLGLPHDAPTVLFVGQLAARKGPDVAVEAIARLGPPWQLLLAGTGELEASLRAQVARAGATGCVRFLGAVPHDRLPGLMAACDVLAVPSRREGLPNALVEGLAAAMPVVAAAVGGSTELVHPGRTGWLVAPDAPHALAAALADLRAHPASARACGAAGRALVRTRFDVAANAARLEAIVARLGRRRASG